MRIYDCHSHSEHSHDSKQTIRQIADKALSLGFDGVTVTNHYDYLTPGVADELVEQERLNALAAIDEAIAIKQEYEGRLELLCGAEIGSPFRNKEKSDELIMHPNADVIIASAHVVTPTSNEGKIYDYNPFKERNPAESDRVVEAYFTDIYRNIAFCDIDIVGHVSYLQRYIVKDGVAPFNVKRYTDACVDIMKAAISRGIAIEINAKSIALCESAVFNELEFFKLYKSLGGELVTIGTDSHAPEHFELAFKAHELLKAAGFEKACYFKMRNPYFYSLD